MNNLHAGWVGSGLVYEVGGQRASICGVRVPTTTTNSPSASVRGSSGASVLSSAVGTPSQSGDFSSTLAQAAHLPGGSGLGQKAAAPGETFDKRDHGKKADEAAGSDESTGRPAGIISIQAVAAAMPLLPLSVGALADAAGFEKPPAAGAPQTGRTVRSAADLAQPAITQQQDVGTESTSQESGTTSAKLAAPGDALNTHMAPVVSVGLELTRPEAAQGQRGITDEHSSRVEGRAAQAVSPATPSRTASEAGGLPALAAAKTVGHEAVPAAMPVPVPGEQASVTPVSGKLGHPVPGASRTDAATGTSRPTLKEAGASSEATRQDSSTQTTGDAAANSSGNGSGNQSASSANDAVVITTPTATHDGGLPGQAFVSLQAPQSTAGSDVVAGASSKSKDGNLDSAVIADAANGAASQQALPSINTARVIQSMQGSEMRVGMHSVEFGSVSISTTMTHQTLAAQISFDHAELGRALTAHLPAMEARLSNEYGMQARVEVRDGSLGAAAENGGGANQQQGQGNAPSRLTRTGETVVASRSVATTAAVREIVDGGGRVDIRV